ncbi:MAG: hypothetical protein KDB14_25295 [Planctomycetales bacterium]|nr:hypothetical protein [Planctomycetales bacterium]
MARIPLAWKNLTHSKPKLALSLAGVAFAVVLMFMQTGFRNALFDSTVQPIDELDADLVLLSRARYSISRLVRFPHEQLGIAAATPGVREVKPLYIEMLAAVFRCGNRRARPIRVFGIDPDHCPLTNPEILAQLDKIRRPQAALMDRRTKSVFGLDPLLADNNCEQLAELANQKIAIVGAFNLGTDFANEGTLAISAESFADYFPHRGNQHPLNVVDLGLVKVADPARVQEVKARLIKALPPETLVFTRDELRRREIRFWATNTPIGIIFGIGTLMGFVVGVIICYQVIYNDINDHMAEFATLKAMGYPASFFAKLMLTQAVYLSMLGFLPGLLVSWGMFSLLAASTGLLMRMTLWRAAIILALTVLMCVISGAIAMRRLISADPASLF